MTVETGFPPSQTAGSSPLNQTVVLGPVRKRALRESVFEALLLAIVRGEMKPGVWSNHRSLAEQMQVSVTPLREALQDLAVYGIIENQYNRGSIVRPFGPTQLLEIFHVRSLLEAEATRLACPQLDRNGLTQLQRQTGTLISKESPTWDAEVIAEDERLHGLIAASCGSQRLREEIARYRSLLACIRRAVADHHYPFKVALPEHLAIIDALLRRQPEAAAKAMTHHILSSAKVCSDVLFPDQK